MNTGKPTILVWEPDERAAEAVKTLVMGEGYRVMTIASESELNSFQYWSNVKAIILGDRLPGTNPPLVVEGLNRNLSRSMIPILLLVRGHYIGSIRMQLASRFWAGKPVSEGEFLRIFRWMVE